MVEALTHGSVGYEAQKCHRDNQRLEFLGDAVLQLVLSAMLYEKLPQADEGVLTKLRSQLVSAKALASISRHLHIGDHIIMGRGEEANGGRLRESALADALEAIAGAIYLDGGLIAAQAFVQRHFTAELERLLNQPIDQNPKGQLQEMLQAIGPTSPSYQIIQESGPDHLKSFLATVLWHEVVLGSGTGTSKKEAETAAAKAALDSPNLQHRATEISLLACVQETNKPPRP